MRLAIYLAVCLLTMALCSADAEPASPEDMPFYLEAVDERGHILAYAGDDLANGWTRMGAWTEDTLRLRGPEPGQEPIAEEGRVYFFADYDIAVRRGDALHQMPWPIHPSQRLWSATFSDGTQAVLRMAEDAPLAKATARWQGETREMYPYPALAVAQLQLSGETPQNLADLQENWDVAAWIAAADCRSLVASVNVHDRKAAFEFATLAVRRMLEEYKTQQGQYPATLEELWQGGNAVAPFSPGNPFAWPQPLCVSSEEGPRLEYRLTPDGSNTLLWIGLP